MENIGKEYLILTLPMKTKEGLIMITKSAKKYLYGTKVYSVRDPRKSESTMVP